MLFRKVLKPLHNGLEKQSLYSTSSFRSYSMCLDTGDAATSACSRDLREYLHGLNRTASAYAYKDDGPSGTCHRHVLVEYCSTGGGVANEYCHKFSAAGEAEIDSRALLKMTPGEVQVVRDALNAGLKGAFGDDRYVYYISEDGGSLNWHGFNGTANLGINAPYVICPTHTREAWENYESGWTDTETEYPEWEDEGGEAPLG